MDIMDTSYIKLCAEIAYNEVIFEQSLQEESVILNEFSLTNLFDKFKTAMEKLKTFVINLKNKIINFIMNKIKELKVKIQEYKQKKNKPQNASFSFVDQLMEMVLTEGTNYDQVLERIHSEIISDLINKFNDTISLQKDFSNKILDALNKYNSGQSSIEFAIKNMNRESQNFIEQSNITVWYQDIERKIENIKNKEFDIDKDSYPSDGFLNTCVDICNEYKNKSDMQLSFLDYDIKQHEETYREVAKDKELTDAQRDILIAYHRNSLSICNKGIENFNKLSSYFVQTAKLILTLPSKTFTTSDN